MQVQRRPPADTGNTLLLPTFDYPVIPSTLTIVVPAMHLLPPHPQLRPRSPIPFSSNSAPPGPLIDEARDLRAVLQPAVRTGRCELVEIPNARGA